MNGKLKQAERLETLYAGLADDDMIVKVNAENARCIANMIRELNVVPAGFGIA